jgi:putative ABC transport system permease protein
MLLDYLKIVLGNLTKRKTRTYLTMIGIFIGIAAVVSLIGLGEGLRVAITGQFGFLGADILSVQASGLAYGPPGTMAVDPLSDDLAEKIERIPGVESAFNRYIETIAFEFNDKRDITGCFSIPGKDNVHLMVTMLNLKAEQGRLLRHDDGKRVMLGNSYSKDDNRFGKAVKAGDRVLINGASFEVIGIMEKKGNFMMDFAVLVTEDVLLDDLREGEDTDVNVIAIKVKDPARIDDVQEDIEELLRKERDVDKGEEDFAVQSPQQALDALNNALFAVQLFVYIIALISLVVGGIGIMNTMYTAVLERTREIGIMKSIGAKNSMIFIMFFIESGLLGMIGGIVGILIGAGFAYGFAALGRTFLGSGLIRAEISFALVLGALFFSCFVGLVAGLVPAYQAAKKNPVDALRFVK